MKISFFIGVTLSSVALTTGVLELPANALDFTSILEFFQETSPSRASPDQPIEQAVPTQVEQNSAQPSESVEPIEQAVHNQVNQYRASLGLPALALDSRISSQARTHSQNMASGAVSFSHDGFNQRVAVIATVIPYSGSAENVTYNQGYADPATQAVQGWLNSTGHRTNIEAQYNLTGIGVAKNANGSYYFTQIFVRSSQAPIP